MTKRVKIFVTSASEELVKDYIKPFKEAFKDINVQISAYPDPSGYLITPEAMRQHAQEWILDSSAENKPDVIWAISSGSADAALHATRTMAKPIPIVGSALSSKFVKTLQDGDNITGIVNCGWELGGERFRLLHQLKPDMRRIAVLMKSGNDSCEAEFRLIEEAAKTADPELKVTQLDVQGPNELAARLAPLEQNVDALLITHLPLFQNHRDVIREHIRNVPTAAPRTFFLTAGAVLAYSSDLEDQMRESAKIVQELLSSGMKASDIEMRRPRKFELAVNFERIRGLELEPKRLLMNFSSDKCPPGRR